MSYTIDVYRDASKDNPSEEEYMEKYAEPIFEAEMIAWPEGGYVAEVTLPSDARNIKIFITPRERA